MNKYIYIKREIENVLQNIVKQFPVVALTGPRQSGKSTLLKKIFPKYTYITFDDPLIREQAINDPNLFLSGINGNAIIDEIQYVPDLFSYIKIFIDKNRNTFGRFILTGSHQYNLMKNVSESLAGRIALLELLPFSITEKKRIKRKYLTNPSDYFLDSCLQGSYPEISIYKDKPIQFWYSSYLQTYLERDIRSIFDIGNLRDFQRLIQLLASRCSQILNLSSFAVDIGVSVNTIKKWISILEASRIIYLLPPYYKNFGKRIIKRPKLYFLDNGFLCYLLSINTKNNIFLGQFSGPLFENFCIQETIKAFLEQGIRPPLYFLRTSNGLEIDLIIEKQSILYPVEFKISKTPKREMIKQTLNIQKTFQEIQFKNPRILSLIEKKIQFIDVLLDDFDSYISWLKKYI